MAYSFSRASNQYLSTSNTPVSGPPFAMSCWFYKTNNSNTTRLMSLGKTGSNDRYTLTTLTSGTLQGLVVQGSSIGNATSTNTINLNAWNHVVVNYVSSTSRNITLNGIKTNGDTVASAPAIDILLIGASLQTGVITFPMDGLIADAGVWNTVLSDSEIASLSKGVSCSRIKPQNLQFYVPLVRNTLDVRGGLAVTNNNGATVADHPRLYL